MPGAQERRGFVVSFPIMLTVFIKEVVFVLLILNTEKMRGLWSPKLHQVCVSHKLVTDCRNSGYTIVFMNLPDTEGHWPSPVEAAWVMLWALLQGKKLSYGE